MFQRFNHRAGHYALLLTVGTALFLVNLGGATLWDVDEGRNSTAAYEMLESGNHVIPTFNGALRSHKPALLYWLQMAAYAVLGVNEFAARLPSALAALVSLLVVYELGRRLFGAPTGLLAGVVLGSTVMFPAAGRFANPDALLCLFVLLTLACAWRAFDPGAARMSAGWAALAGAAAGLAVLAKGPSGLLLPEAVLVVFLAWSGRLRMLWDRRVLLGFLTFGLVALPWYVWVGVDTKWQFLREFLLTHNLERALTPMENHGGPPYYYVLVLLVGFAPWSVFLGLAVWFGAWSALTRPWGWAAATWERAADREDGVKLADAYRFLGSWCGVYLVAFSLATTKLPNYVLPICPAVALLTARFLDRWRRGAVAVPRPLLGTSIVALALVGVVTAVGLLLAGGAIPMPFMRGRYTQGVEVWAVLGAVPLLGAALAAWCVRRQQRQRFVVTVAAVAVLFVVPLAAWGITALNRHKAPRPLVEAAGALRRDADIRIGAYQLEYLPSLNFYCQRNVIHLTTEQQVREFLRCPIPVYLFLPAGQWEHLAPTAGGPCRIVGRHRDLYRACEVIVVTNR
ncbi:MAG: glycosyltransferase family 39 protein [Gemmataceae bacterium]|nr:glycosyltransferase family 39 protein [Gemmataceae bacterium]